MMVHRWILVIFICIVYSGKRVIVLANVRRMQGIGGEDDRINNIPQVSQRSQRKFAVVETQEARRLIADGSIPHTLEQARNLSARNRQNSINNQSQCPEQCRCHRAREVHCTFQQIGSFPSMFPTNTKKINLAYNKLARLPNNALSTYGSSLRFLFLQSNKIRSIRGNVLAGLVKLSVLRLSWNQMSAIHKYSLTDLRSLKSLYLDNNRLYFIHPEAFRGMTKLRLVQLEGNSLSRLHSDTFITVRFTQFFRYSNVQYLYLSNNKFVVLPRSILAEINRLKHVYLHGNPWECSCHLQWLHQWIRESGKYRCKRSIFRRNEPAICATCQSPRWLRHREISGIHYTNITCTSPSLIDTQQKGRVHTTNYSTDPSLLEIENEAMLFRYGKKNKLRGSLRLDNRGGSLVLMHCNASQKPVAQTTRVSHSNVTFTGRIDVQMKCIIEYPERHNRLDRILSPYLNSALSFTTVTKRRRSRSYYKVSIIGRPLTNLAPVSSGLRIRSAILAKASPLLHRNKFVVTIFGNRFKPEKRTLELLYQTEVEFQESTPVGIDMPWTLMVEPRSDYVRTTLVSPGRNAILKCTAMGFPKPAISWILPDERLITPGKRVNRFTATLKGKLLIRAVKASDSGMYRCLAISNKKPTGGSSSDIASFQVQVIPASSQSRQIPVIRLENGNDVKLNCSAWATPEAVYSWTLPSKDKLIGAERISNFQSYTNGTLMIHKFSQNHSGIYRVGYLTADFTLTTVNETQTTMVPPTSHSVTTVGSKRPSSLSPSSWGHLGNPNTSLDTNSYQIYFNMTTKRVQDSSPSSDDRTFVQTVTSENVLLVTKPLVIHYQNTTFTNDADVPSQNLTSQHISSSTVQYENKTSITISSLPVSSSKIPANSSTSQKYTETSQIHEKAFDVTTTDLNDSAQITDQNTAAPFHKAKDFTVIVLEETQYGTPIQQSDAGRSALGFEPLKQRTVTYDENEDITTQIQKTNIVETRALPAFVDVINTYTDNNLTDPTNNKKGTILDEVHDYYRGITKLESETDMDNYRIPTMGSFKIEKIYVKYGDPLNLSCISTTNISSTVWRFVKINETSAQGNMFPGLEHDGVFSCGLSGVNGSTFYKARVNVMYSPPAFIGNLQNNISIDYGKSKSIPCQATGIPQPNVRWELPASLRSSPEVIYTTPDNDLYITKAVPRLNGSFNCKAISDIGVIERTVILNIISAAPQVSSSLSVVVGSKEGESARLDCNAQAIPLPSYTWSRPGDQFLNIDDSKSETISNGSLVIHDLTLNDAGVYLCTIRNEIGTTAFRVKLVIIPRNITTTVTTEVIHGSTPPPVFPPTPFFHKIEVFNGTSEAERPHRIQRILHDDTLYLNCRDYRNPQRAQRPRHRDILWTLPSGEITRFPVPVRSYRHRVLYNGTLRIRYAQLDDEGAYQCRDLNQQKRENIEIITVYVITSSPSVKQALSSTRWVDPGTTAHADCSPASGKPTATCTWTTPSDKILTAGSWNGNVRVMDSGRLVLVGISQQTIGKYICTLSNIAGEVSRVVEFKFHPHPPTIKARKYRRVYIQRGSSRKIDCSVTGSPPPRIFWRTPGGRSLGTNQVKLLTASNSTIAVLDEGTIWIKYARLEDSGIYRCYAYNRLGSRYVSLDLVVFR